MLTEQDIDILLEAMQTWERKNADTAFSGGLLGAILMAGRTADGATGDVRRDFKNSMNDVQEKDRQNAEVAILIKAKLISMKRELQSRYEDDLRAGLIPDR